MELRYFGANCFTLTNSTSRLVFDDNLEFYGTKSISNNNDILFFTEKYDNSIDNKFIFNNPGEFEIKDVLINGLKHKNFNNDDNLTIYKINISNINILFTGNCNQEFSQKTLEDLGMIDVLIMPCVDDNHMIGPKGVARVIRELEPKIYIPSFYGQNKIKVDYPLMAKQTIQEALNLDVKEETHKIKIKNLLLLDNTKTQLVFLEP